MEVRLVVVGGKHAGQELPVAGPKFFIGRAEDCHLRPGSDLVSRHHAVLLVEEGFVAVRDFGSKNGTFVNGQRLKHEQELKAGDRLRIGPLEFDVKLIVEVGGKKKPKVHSVQEAAARTVEAAAEDELDILSLLGDQEGGVSATRTTDTMPLSGTPTAGIDAGQTVATPASAAKDEPKKPERKDKPAEAAGRAHATKKTAADTQEAAADVLRQLFGRRR